MKLKHINGNPVAKDLYDENKLQVFDKKTGALIRTYDATGTLFDGHADALMPAPKPKDEGEMPNPNQLELF